MGRKHDLEYQKIYKGKIGKINFFPPSFLCPRAPPKKEVHKFNSFRCRGKGKKWFLTDLFKHKHDSFTPRP